MSNCSQKIGQICKCDKYHTIASVIDKTYYYLHFQNVDLPESMSPEMKSLLEGLLKRDVEERLGCQGRG